MRRACVFASLLLGILTVGVVAAAPAGLSQPHSTSISTPRAVPESPGISDLTAMPAACCDYSHIAAPSAVPTDPTALLYSYLTRVLTKVPKTQQGEHLGEQCTIEPLNLIGGNFPIVNFPDAVSSLEELASPEVVYNSSHSEYLIVWQGFSRATSDNIYARRLSAAGSLQGSLFAVCEAAGQQVAPAVAYDANGDQYWVVWVDFRSGETGKVYARRLASNGALLGSEIVVNTSSHFAFAPRVACGEGYSVIVWTESYGNSLEVCARRYNGTGNAVTNVVRVSSAGAQAGIPDIVYEPVGHHFMVVWQELHSGSAGWDIMGQRLAGPLYLDGGLLTISSSSGDQKEPRVAYNAASDRYCVVWQDGRSLQTWDIYGQLLSRWGMLIGSALPIFTGDFHDMTPVVAAHGSSSQFLVSFIRDISGAENYQIYGRTVSGAGALSGVFVVREWHNMRVSPAIAYRGGSNDYLVVWQDHGMGTQPDIQAQRVRSDGVLQGALIMVSAGRKGQEAPSLVYNSVRNQYLVVWQDYRSGSDYDIYGQRISATGGLVGQELVIATAGALNGNPVVAYNSRSDEYLVVWQRIQSTGTGYEIYAQRVGGGGSLIGSAIWISRDTGTVHEGVAHVVYNEFSNDYMVVWHAFSNGSWKIWGQRISATGQLLGGNFVISASGGNPQGPRIAYNRQRHEYLVVWQDDRNGGRWDIYGQRLSASGGLIGSNLAVATASGNKGRCDLSYNSQNNEYLVVWGDTRAGSNVYGQRLNATAGLIGGDFAISAAANSEVGPAVEYSTSSSEYLAVWWRYYDASDWDIYGGRVSATGGPVGGRFGISTANEVQRQPDLAYNTSNGQFLIVWQDFRAGSYDIYGQRWVQTVMVTPTPTRTLTPVSGPYRVRLPIVLKKYTAVAPYLDDFSNPNSGWPQWDNAYSSVGYINGEYRILVKIAGVWQAAFHQSFHCRDCTLEVDARYAGTNYDVYGLVFGVTDAGNYYVFVVGETGYYSILKWMDGQWHFVVNWTASSYIKRGQQTNHLRIDRNGWQITAYINGNSVATVSDGSLIGSLGVGLLAGGKAYLDARFDNFAVYSVGAGSAFSRPSWKSGGLEGDSGIDWDVRFYPSAPVP